MKRILVSVGFLLLATGSGFAQGTQEHYGQGYAFFSPGVAAGDGSRSGIVHFGGGGELLFKRVGVGGELGYLTPWRSFSDGIGVFSPNVSYNFGSGKVSPFLTGGYSLFFRNGSANGLNYGGGVNYWFAERTAVRLEVRDNVLIESGNVHFVGFRVGLTFR